MTGQFSNFQTLDQLWQAVDELNKKHFPDNVLRPIVGGGKEKKPKFMLLFINPTHKNISSSLSWNGPRWPFIGTKYFWRVLFKAGLFDSHLMEKVEKNEWSEQFAVEVYQCLAKRDFYLTNLVKWTGVDGSLPDRAKIKLFQPILLREIELVRPKYIITFGLIPFNALTGRLIKLGQEMEYNLRHYPRTYHLTVNGYSVLVLPCHFPTGRGRPEKAIATLKLLRKLV